MTAPLILTGNANVDVADYRGWLVGHFVSAGDGALRRTEDVEIAWRAQRKGDARPEWVTDETRTTVVILVSGRHRIVFRGASVAEAWLTRPGDYVAWGPGIDHRWYAATDLVLVCIRWPSLATYA
jgi:hypothetical protein